MGNVIKNIFMFWPKGIMHYLIDESDFPPGTSDWRKIKKAIAHWNEKTKVILKPWDGVTEDHVIFKRDKKACQSAVGKQGGRQEIRCLLGDQYDENSIIHEIGHAFGLHHEHCREDRDKYMHLHFHNIDRKELYNFRVEPGSIPCGEYDYNSIMHYPNTAFSVNGETTISTNKPLGSRAGLSALDVATINLVVTHGYNINIGMVDNIARPYGWKC